MADDTVKTLAKKRDNLIYASYEDPKNASLKENSAIVDIIQNYTWNNETAAKEQTELKYSTSLNIPRCYVIEREQTVSSSIMNIVRDAKIISDGASKALNFLADLGSKMSAKKNDDKGGTEEKKEGGQYLLEGATEMQSYLNDALDNKFVTNIREASKIQRTAIRHRAYYLHTITCMLQKRQVLDMYFL